MNCNELKIWTQFYKLERNDANSVEMISIVNEGDAK